MDGVIRSIRALFNNSKGRNMPRVLAAFTGFWPTVLRPVRKVFPSLPGRWSRARGMAGVMPLDCTRPRAVVAEPPRASGTSGEAVDVSVQQGRICTDIRIRT